MPRIGRLTLALLALACAGEAPPAEPFVVPRPDLAGVDAAVHEQLGRLAAELERALADADAQDRTLVPAIGRLGRTYHAYDLTAAAAACYREAQRRAPAAEWSYYLGFIAEIDGELEVAVESYRRVLDAEPANPAAAQRLADVLARLGRDTEAAAIYRRLLDVDEVAAAASRGLGTLAAGAGEHLEAITHFERALELQPRATAVHYQMSQSYRTLGRDADAERHARLAGTAQVGFADPRVAALDELALGAGVRLARGGVALAEGRSELAVDEYLQAVAADPENVAARTNLALLLAREGRTDEARRHLEEALRLEPDDATVRAALGTLSLAGGAAGEALETFDAVLERHPEHAGALRGRADALIALGRVADAMADLELLARRDPLDGGARLRLGVALQASGDLPAARRELEAALALDLTSREAAAARLGLANLAAGAGDLRAALEGYDAALALQDDLVEAAYNRAGVLSRLGQHRDAEVAYRRVLALDSGASSARFFLGEALLIQGRPGEALEIFREALARSPEDDRVRVGVATSLARLDRHREALQTLETGRRQLPGSPLLAHELARLLASSPDRGLRDGERAVALAGPLLEGRPSAAVAETLAMALAESGRHAEAAELQRRLIAQLGAAGDPAAVARLRATLGLYEAGESCCPPPS